MRRAGLMLLGALCVAGCSAAAPQHGDAPTPTTTSRPHVQHTVTYLVTPAKPPGRFAQLSFFDSADGQSDEVPLPWSKEFTVTGDDVRQSRSGGVTAQVRDANGQVPRPDPVMPEVTCAVLIDGKQVASMTGPIAPCFVVIPLDR